MANFWNIVDKVIEEADVILEVIDARMINKTRNQEIEGKVLSQKKVLIKVINKCDLVDIEGLNKIKKSLEPCVFISAKNFLGTTMLRQKILKASRGEKVVVGVVGYPNTGKSSVINSLKGRASAKVSSVSGYTKGKQLIKADSKITLLDTPGVLSYTDEFSDKDIEIATKNFYDEKDPDFAVLKLIKAYKNQIINYYKIENENMDNLDEEEILELIALRLNKKVSGGQPDLITSAKMILKDWQNGKIKL